MSQFIHIGFGNIVNTDKIIAVVSPDSAPVKRLVQKARETGNAVDATQGRRTKAVLGKQSVDFVGAAAGDDCGEGSAAAGYAAVCRGGKTG